MITFKHYCLSLPLLIASALYLPDVADAQDLGGGYTCEGTTIFNKRGKAVKLGKARSAIQAKIDAVVGTSAKAKSKRANLKGIKSRLTKCSRGQITGQPPGGTGANLTGVYSGSLALTSANLEFNQCETDDPLSVSFTVILEEGTLRIDASNPGDPFRFPARGSAEGSGFVLKDVKGVAVREELEIVATNVTETSADLRVTQSIEKRRGPSCRVVFVGPVTRTALP